MFGVHAKVKTLQDLLELVLEKDNLKYTGITLIKLDYEVDDLFTNHKYRI